MHNGQNETDLHAFFLARIKPYDMHFAYFELHSYRFPYRAKHLESAHPYKNPLTSHILSLSAVAPFEINGDSSLSKMIQSADLLLCLAYFYLKPP